MSCQEQPPPEESETPLTSTEQSMNTEPQTLAFKVGQVAWAFSTTWHNEGWY